MPKRKSNAIAANEDAENPKATAPASKKSKQSSLDNFAIASSGSTAVSVAGKPQLVILPGASGSLSKVFKEKILPQLSRHFVIHVREGKWQNWNLTNPVTVESVLSLCPSSPSSSPWYILGHSFGCRIILSMIVNRSFAVPPAKIVLTSYPMFGERVNQERVELLQAVPKGQQILCLSGESDEFLLRGGGSSHKSAKVIYQEIISSMKCSSSVTLQMIPSAGHGLVEGGKKTQEDIVTSVVNYLK